MVGPGAWQPTYWWTQEQGRGEQELTQTQLEQDPGWQKGKQRTRSRDRRGQCDKEGLRDDVMSGAGSSKQEEQKEVVDEIEREQLEPEREKKEVDEEEVGGGGGGGGGEVGAEEELEPQPAPQPGDEIDVAFPAVQQGIDFNQLDNALQHVQVWQRKERGTFTGGT